MKKLHVALILFLATFASIFISACGGSTATPPASSGSTSQAASTAGTPGAYNCVSGNLVASGSTALAPLVQAVAKQYTAKCSSASITVNLGGSGTGLSQVEAGTVQIGNSDIFKKAGQDDLVDHQVAVVVFSLIVNSKVTGVTGLTLTQIKDIYSGKVTNWKDVGGPDLKIVVVSRPASSGTRATFQSYILGGPETIAGPTNLTTDSTGTVVNNVKATDGAIGYVALAAAQSSGLTVLTIDGSAPTADLVKNNTYKFWNIEHMYTKGKPTDLAQALIDYMASDDGKTQAADLKFLPIADMTADAIQAHQPKS